MGVLMKAIKITIDGAAFLLPDTHHYGYEFPTLVIEHRAAIAQHIEAGHKFATDPLTDHFAGLPDLTDFKQITGIIGFPLDMRDAEMYAALNSVEIVLEVEL
jgi:hypothetical protein